MDASAFLQGGTRLALCLLLGITLVSALQGWKSHKECQYQINGRTVAGIPNEQNQHVGIHYRGTLTVQSHSALILVMKLENVIYWQIHEELSDGWWAESSSTAQEKFSELPLTNSSFIVKLRKNGEVDTIYVDMEVSNWEANLIKGVVWQLQYRNDLAFKRQFNAIQGSEFSESNIRVRTMENTPFGRCETLYQVTPVPHIIGVSFPELYPPHSLCASKKYYEIFKTINYSNCESQAETHFGLPETMKCDPAGNYCGGFWNRVSGSRIAGCAEKKEFIILQTETNSREVANLQLHNASMASISSFITMNLTSVTRLEQRLALPSVKAELSPFGYEYTAYDFAMINDILDAKTDEPSFTEGSIASNATECVGENAGVSESNNCIQMPTYVYNVTKQDDSTYFWRLPPSDFEHPPQQPLSAIFLHQKECPEVNSKVQKFKEIITDVAKDFEDAQNIPNTLPLEKLTSVVELCRTMPLNSLKKAIGMIMHKTIKTNKLLLTERNLYRDVLVMCGTPPSIWIIAELIEQYKITGEEAARTIASLPEHLRDPRPIVVQRLYNLTRSEAVSKDRKLKITATLALSNFIRIACVNTRARSVRFPHTVLSPLCTEEDIEPYLRWFSSQLNADPALKRAYILALGNTGASFGLEALTTAAKNTNYSVYLRATAVIAMKYQAFRYSEDTSQVLFSLFQDYTQPIGVRISAVSMIFFSRPQYDMWQRIALSTWYEPSTAVAGFVRSSLVTLSKFKDPGYKSMSENARRVVLYSKPISSKLHLSYNWLYAIITQDLEDVWALQHIITNEIDAGSIYFRLTKRISQLTRLPVDAEIWMSNKDEFLSLIKEYFYPRGNRPGVRPPIQDLERPTHKIRQILNIKQRTMPDLEGDVHANFDKLTERLFIFDKKYVQDFLNGFEKPTKQIKFDYQSTDNSELEFSVVTELGFPVTFTLSEPRFIRFTAKFNASQSSSAVETTLSAMLTAHRIGKLSFYTAWDKTLYTAESHVHTSAHIPEINLKGQLDAESQRLKFEVHTKLPEKGHILLQHSNEMFTSHRNVGETTPRILTRTWKPIKLKPLSQMSKSLRLGRNFEAHFNYSTQLKQASPLDCLRNPISVLTSPESSSLQIKIFNVPNMQFDIGIGSAKAQNGEVTVTYGPDKSRSVAKAESAREEDLLSQIETGTNSTRKIRTIPSGSIRPPATDKPSVTHKTISPTTSTTLSPAKELLSNVIRQTAHDVVEEVMQRVKGNQNIEASPKQHVSEVSEASNTNLTQTQGPHDYSTYLLHKSLGDISNGKSKMIYMNITLSNAHEPEQNASTYSAHVIHAEDDNQRLHHLGIFLRDENEPSELEIGLTSTLLSPEVSYLNPKDMHQTTFEAVLLSSLQYRLQDKHYHTALKANMHRSNEKMQALKKRLTQRQCSDMINPECRALAYEAMLSDTYNVTLIYSSEEQYFAPLIEKSLDLASLYLLPYASKAELKNCPTNTSYNMMNLAFNVAEDLRSCNLQADTKSKHMVFQDIPVQPELMKMLLYHPHRSVSRLITSPSVCGMSLSRISTFDEQEYNYNITRNWHVLTKDATGKTRFMVLARASMNGTIELEVNMDNHVVVFVNASDVAAQQGRAKIDLNKHLEYRDLNETLLLQVKISSVPKYTVTMHCPEHGMDITYNGDTLLIEAHEMTRGRLVGLCGDNNGEKIAEFQTPSKITVISPQEFAASYSLPEDQHVTTSEAPPSSAATSTLSSSKV